MEEKPSQPLSLEIEQGCDYVSRETIEICVNKEKDEWVMAVFLEPNKNDSSLFDVQILNQDGIMSVNLNSIRKFAGCNDVQMFVNMITISMGAGIFSLPWALAGSSIIPGLILIFLSMLYVFNTCKEVLECADRYNYDNMGKILEKQLSRYNPLVGKVFKIVAIGTCWISTILCLIGYYIIVYENGHSIVPNMDARLWFIIGPVLTSVLTFLPNHMLSWTSIVSLIVTILVIIALIIEMSRKGVCKIGKDGVHIFSIGRGYFCIIANVMMSMSIQYNMPSLYKEVQIRDVKRTTKVMAWAFITVFAIFSITVVLAYFRFGPHISGDFLEDMENTIPGYIVKASAMLVCIFVAPLCVLPITDDIELWVNTYRLNQNSALNDTNAGSKDIETINTQEENIEQKKNITLDIALRIIKVVAISLPVLASYLVKIIFKKSLEIVNMVNGIIVLFCYCAVTPLIVSPKVGTKEYILSGVALVVTILAAIFIENYPKDLDKMTPNW